MSTFDFFGLQLDPPPGFVPIDSFPGFVNRDMEASIAVTQFPAPFREIVAAFTPDRLTAQGMQWLGQESGQMGEQPARLVHVHQSAGGRSFIKWLGLVGNDQLTHLITATVPREFAHVLSAVVRDALLSAQVSKPSASAAEPACEFEIEPVSPFQLAKRLPQQLLFTADGVFPLPHPEDALFVAAQTFLEREIADQGEFFRHRLERYSILTNAILQQESSVQIGNLTGMEGWAVGHDMTTRRQCGVFQTVLYRPLGYVLMQGVAVAERMEELLPVFRSMAASFRLLDSATISDSADW